MIMYHLYDYKNERIAKLERDNAWLRLAIAFESMLIVVLTFL